MLTQNNVNLYEIHRISFNSMLYGDISRYELQNFLKNVKHIGISELKIFDKFLTNEYGEVEDSVISVILGNFT